MNKESDKNVEFNNLFKVYHQNGRGLKGKINEFMFSLLSELPHINCLTEHLKDYEIDLTPITKYKLYAKYCRKILKNGSVRIYIQESLKFTNINLQNYCKEQDIEVCSVKLKLKENNVIILCVYRALSGNFDYFLNKLDNILNSLYNHKTEFIISGDLNINYLETSNKKQQVGKLLATYN